MITTEAQALASVADAMQARGFTVAQRPGYVLVGDGKGSLFRVKIDPIKIGTRKG